MAEHNVKPLKIEKGIPIPPPSGEGYRATFRKMDIGDSVLIETEDKEKMRSRITSTFKVLQKEDGRKFVSRSVDGGVRIWRTE